MAEFDVFVGNHAIINFDIYDLWLRGLTAEEAADFLLTQLDDGERHRGVVSAVNVGNGSVGAGSQGRRSTPSGGGGSLRGSVSMQASTASFVLADVHDHFRTLTVLERFLQNPPSLLEQLNVQLTPETQAVLIRKYYEYDEVVFREFAGKKLSTRARNALDDAADRLRVRAKSCRRQFDNVKRVFKQVEDLDGYLIENIQTHFLLPTGLAEQYACMVFVLNNRFELTGKRKLNYLTFGDVKFSAHEMRRHWTGGDDDADLDREFVMELRELKALAEREALEEHKTVLLSGLKGKIEERSFADLEANFKNYSRALINIAHGLNHTKEARDIFVDIVEKVVEPAKSARWTSADLERFVKTYSATAKSLPVVARSNRLTSVLDRYLSTIGACVLRLYHD